MTLDSVITLGGTIVTLISMVITIIQTANAKKYRKQIKADIRKISLAKCTRGMEDLLETCNQLPSDFNNIPRGIKIHIICKDINSQLSNSIAILSKNGVDNEIRMKLVEVQTLIHSYEKSYSQESLNGDILLQIRSILQDAISISNENLYGIGE